MVPHFIRRTVRRLSGRARQKSLGGAVPAGPMGDGPDGDLFHADISEVVLTRLNPEATLLVIESWTPQRGLRVTERE